MIKTTKRKVFKVTNGKSIRAEGLHAIKKGDTFYMTGDEYVDGEGPWVAVTDAYLDKSSGVWGIQVED